MSVPAPEPVGPTLVVGLTVNVRLEEKIDLIDYFSRLSDESKTAYAEVDLVENGYEDEWQRPMAWLVEVVSEEACPLTLVGPGPVFADIPEIDESVAGRYGVHRHWSVDNFYALIGAVDWLARDWLDRHAHGLVNTAWNERDRRLAALIAAETDAPLFERGS